MSATLQIADARRMMDALPAAARAALAAEIHRETLKDKAYQQLPLGQHIAAFLRIKRKVGADATITAYESTLARFAQHFQDLDLDAFEKPVGTERLEEWLDSEWGAARPATYNRHLAALREFFKFQVRRGRMYTNPATDVDPAKKRDVYRTTFSKDERRAIIAAASEQRDRLALRLLLHYGLRSGSLRAVQFKHFDHVRKKLAVFLKGGKVRNLPIPDPAFWHDLERLILDTEAQPGHYLMPSRWQNRHGAREYPERQLTRGGLTKWWYRRLADAGIVPEGTTSGERMHKARHTAGQALLDSSHNLKAVQKMLGHASITTTADTYTDWDDDALAASIAQSLEEEDG